MAESLAGWYSALTYSVLTCLGSSRIDGPLQLQIVHPRALNCRAVLKSMRLCTLASIFLY
jgi:hypothetical protein